MVRCQIIRNDYTKVIVIRIMNRIIFLILALFSTIEIKGEQMNRYEKATLGGGCFWCTEAVFESLPGVITVISGYAGGAKTNPTYEEICTGKTGHAEVVEITFDPAKISYAKLLEIFWKAHDPTTLNRQGADVGTQYRSVIFYHNESQKVLAEKSRSEAQKQHEKPIVTEIKPLVQFYQAEEYHQNYFEKNPDAAYCRFVIKPKLEKMKEKDFLFN